MNCPAVARVAVRRRIAAARRPQPATGGTTALAESCLCEALVGGSSRDRMTGELSWGRRFLMCAPTHFDVYYAINPWMDSEVPVDRGRAEEQWHALAGALRAAGATVELLDPVPDLPDLVFTANLGLVDGRVFVPSRMRHDQRRPEVRHAEPWFRSHGFAIRPLGADVLHEGAGDALPFAGTLVGGYRTRSSASAYVDLARLVPSPILPVELIDERFYHLDLVFCPLDDRCAMAVPGALDGDGARLVRHLVPDLIELSDDEAGAFCANSIVVGRTVVMPACSPRLADELRRRRFEPVVVDVSEFQKAGGGPRCLTLALDVRLGGDGVQPDADQSLSGERVAGDGTGAGDAARTPWSEPRAAAPDEARASAAVQPQARAPDERHLARTYDPLPVTIARAEGAWVYDDRGRRYFDALSAYSALNFGHRHPELVTAARNQLERLTLTSRAFGNEELAAFAGELAGLCGKDRILPMNTGAEAVETAIKTVRKWGYQVKGVAPGQATIVVCHGNFHGRTTTVISFSDDPAARTDFGPFTPGFRSVAFGDLEALDSAIDESVVAFLVEPIQGEAGVIVPPDGYLRETRRLCSARGVLMIADEIQSGLGRTGRTFACEREGVVPDIYVLGKALGGGIMPLSAVVGDDEVLGVFKPGEHGSTFGGNPLACAIGRKVIELLATGEPQANAARLGARLGDGLRAVPLPGVREVRSCGLWFGIELELRAGSARHACERLLAEGVLAKETHEQTVRLSPPLTIGEPELDWLLERVVGVLETLERQEADATAGDGWTGGRAPVRNAAAGSAATTVGGAHPSRAASG